MTWLLDRIFAQGDQPTPRFAFQGTTNWARALAIAVEQGGFDDATLRQRFATVQRRQINVPADTMAFETLFMALVQVAAVRNLSQSNGNLYDICRPAIISWYYAVYNGSKALLAACNGADPQTHAAAARQFQAVVIPQALAVYPFDLSVHDLVPANVEPQVLALRNGSAADLNTVPVDGVGARGALCSYLKGTCDYRQADLEERVKSTPAFRKLGVANFRTKAARAFRDAALAPESVNFLWQAFRYRGKANYRDALYLSYGADNAPSIAVLVADLARVSEAFVFMVSHYIAKRVEAVSWQAFADDLATTARISMPFDLRTI